MKARVAMWGNVTRSVTVNTKATEGATIGLDLKLPDGSVPSLDQLAALIASRVGGAAVGAPSRSSAAPTLWRLIREIPPNVQQVEQLSGAGLVTRRADGEWTTRAITVADSARLTVADGAGEDGNPVIDLAELADSSDGALLAISRDAWGRVAGTREVVADDIPELPADKITSGIFPVERGGTGRDALTSAALLIGAGTDPVDLLAPGDAGHVVRSDGSTWTAAQLGFSDLAGSIDADQVPESAVKQYEGALSIDWSQLESVPDEAARWPEWDEVTDKPTVFPPAPHGHSWSQITGKPDTATRWPEWDEVTGKPSFGSSAFIDEDDLSIDWGQLTNVPPLGGQVESVVGTPGQVDVDSSDAANPIVSLDSNVLAALSAALSAVQPGQLGAVAFSNDYEDLDNKPSIPAGTVTSVGTGAGLTGGPITSSGSIALSQASVDALALAVLALQPGAPVSALTNDAGYLTDLGGLSIGDLGDVNIGAPGPDQNGYALTWSDAEKRFNLQPGAGVAMDFSSGAVRIRSTNPSVSNPPLRIGDEGDTSSSAMFSAIRYGSSIWEARNTQADIEFAIGAGSTGVVVGARTNHELRFLQDDTVRMRIPIGGIQEFADDTSAAAGGVPVDGIYRNGSILRIRVS